MENYQEVYRGKAAIGGLKPNVDNSIRRKIVMVEDGYGRAEAVGIRDGKIYKASTKSQPLSAQAPNDAAPAPLVVRALAASFTSVLRRFLE